MYNLVGLGKTGCNVVRRLEKEGKYACFYIDKNLKTKKNHLCLPEASSPEEYELFSPQKLKNFAKKIEDNLTLLLAGDNLVSGAALSFLEKAKNNNINLSIICFSPELSVLGEKKVLQERVTRNILQEYARSGLFDQIMLVSNNNLEAITGDTTVMSYYNDLNETFAKMYHMINVFKNSDSVSNTFSKKNEISRICTLGQIDLTTGEEKALFPFKETREVVYYFGINKEKLQTEKNLFRKLTDLVKNKKEEYGKVSFGIYPTSYEHDVGYVEYFSSQIQEYS
jgi:hypothetical protein